MVAIRPDLHLLIDHQGHFFPFFILTIAALITLPLTYNLLKPSKGLFGQPSRIWLVECAHC